MPLEHDIGHVSQFAHLIRAGGFTVIIIIAIGSVSTLWSVVHVVRTRHHNVTVMQSILAIMPSLVAAVAVYSSWTDFTALAASSSVPKPAELASVIGFAMSCGFFGTAATCIAVSLTFLAFRRSIVGTGDTD